MVLNMERDTVRDGASLRRQRLMDIISFIHNFSREEGPCTDMAIQTFMLLRHGNRKDTVLQYLRELVSAGVLKVNRTTGDWQLVKNYESTLAIFTALGD